MLGVILVCALQIGIHKHFDFLLQSINKERTHHNHSHSGSRKRCLAYYPPPRTVGGLTTRSNPEALKRLGHDIHCQFAAPSFRLDEERQAGAESRDPVEGPPEG